MISVNANHKQPFLKHEFTYIYPNHGTGMMDLDLDVRCAYLDAALQRNLLIA